MESAELEKVSEVSIFKILKLNSKEWPYILAGVLAAVIMGLSVPAYAVLWGEILGVLEPTYSEEEKQQTQAKGNFYSLLFLAIGIVTGVASFIQITALTFAGENLTNRLRILAFDAILNQEIGWFDDDDNAVGALCTRLSADASSVEGATGSRISVVVQSLSILISCTIVSIYYDWRLGLVTMAIVPFVLAGSYLQVN